MGRKAGSLNRVTNEFHQEFERLKDKYGCPIEAAFKLKNSRNNGHKLQAINLLLKYRYPTLQAIAVADISEPDQLALTWGEPSELEAPDLSDLQIPEIIGE